MSAGLRLDEIVARLGGVARGDVATVVFQVGSLLSAGPGQIAFLANPKYREQLHGTRAGAVIVPPQFADDTDLPRIVHPNSYACYARVAALLNPPRRRPAGVHPSAVVNSPVPATASVGENVVVGQDVTIGENVTLFPGCVIGDGASIGEDSLLYPNVVVGHDCVIGRRAIVHAGAVIGADGFGFARDGERWVKIPQIGRVVLGDDVEIGANTSIDRGALDDTQIGDGVKLDNQIQVAHNVSIGEHTAMAGCVGIAGSAKIGRRCTVGGAGMISGHLEIVDDVHVSAGTLVARSLRQPGQYTGFFPLATHQEWLHNAAQIRRLAQIAERLSEVEKKLERMGKTS
ncbi:UDP-3-O-(3-hydroxymyristoyl)glucosamine N-acyltransferase [Accumulibacter sp.]|uniref:UDP-3-O-(3-hydroxymyristoyl)glucosamine N-acyltransferase n=1 Tax=Accumulibacter sp. TaxID=2053492 RepID=UPI0025DD1EA0|nr:UDP-3-O-(3-hydroxymyristoyl)glucosamine N-acyltransferase [Accumulibacter sp.]MCM8594333.1 UDP-3-O-(3-hydroxymyristoyl)glucosamine N-acyltransferase [Accumulibacter sp.]MCM8625032.1 UDP-3-O-(3-hydroxymyristoyl)glucosamine N-acyltransferase [Accumulibacter sp.]MDS4048477.1 UDP-3-O-(3-hydroxymyristoyl)glucosamine N-acyltransferase [Accumulibacter sp.]